MKRALILGFTLVLLVGLGAFSASLSGTLDVTFTIDTQAGGVTTFLDFASVATVVYEVDGWAFTSTSVLNDAGWVNQSFSAEGALGTLEADAGLDFDPGTATFEKFDVDVSFVFGNADVSVDFQLKDKDLTLVLGIEGETDLLELDFRITFGGDDNDFCDLPWAGVKIDLSFPFCCAEADASIDIKCMGFEKACFSVTGLTVPNLPWLAFDATLCLAVQTDADKVITLTAIPDFGLDTCFTVYISQVQTAGSGPTVPLTLGDIVISGIGLECEIGGVLFIGQSYFGLGSKPSLLSGTPYWEAYKISTTSEGDCCGPLTFDVAVFFDQNSAHLFDVAGFEANATYVFGENWTYKMGYEYSATIGLEKWIIGLTIAW